MSAPPFEPPLAPALPLGKLLAATMQIALDALTTNLAATVGGPVGRAVLAPGSSVPADGCCAGSCDPCGQAHVRLSRCYPSSTFPQQDITYRKCAAAMLAVELELGVYRCAHGLDDAGNPPTPEEMAADALTGADDLAAMRATVFGAFARDIPVIDGLWTPAGPSGYCTGATQLFTVQLNPGRTPKAGGS